MRRHGHPATGASKLYSGITGLLSAGRKREYYCGAGKAMANISISGDIYTCHRFNGLEHMKMGTIENFDAQSQKKYIKIIRPGYLNAASVLPGISAERDAFTRIYQWEALSKNLTGYGVESMEVGIAIYHQLDDRDKVYLKSTALGSSLAFA